MKYFNIKKMYKKCIRLVIFINVTHETNPEIVRAFNDHFSTVGSRIDNFLQQIVSSQNLSIFSIRNSFFFNQTASFEVKTIIKSRPKKSGHISTYSIKVIQYLSNLYL